MRRRVAAVLAMWALAAFTPSPIVQSSVGTRPSFVPHPSPSFTAGYLAAPNSAIDAASLDCVAPPLAPGGLSATVSGDTVTLVWTAPPGDCVPTSYVIEAGSATGLSNLTVFSTGNAATSLVVPGVPGGIYFVRVRASSPIGVGGASNEVQVSVGITPCVGPPAAPALAGSMSGTTVTLTWSTAAGAAGYRIEAGSAPAASNVAVVNLGAGNSLQATAGAATYFVRIHALNACGSSGPSNEVVLTVGAGADPVRIAADRPDDAAGYQIKVMYVIPSDGQDQMLDVNGRIATSVDAWSRWFARESGGKRIRLDTWRGALDVGFFRMSRTNAQVASVGAFVRDVIQLELNAAGFNDPRKVYAVYYGGGSSYSCGGGAWPPELVGNVGAIYLFGTPAGSLPCTVNSLTPSVDAPGYFEFALLHELFHTLGFNATCSLHHVLRGHVGDSPNDLMWSGSAAWQLPARLDIGADDYYRHGRACLDASGSVFMDPLAPNATLPPGWTASGAPLTVSAAGEEQTLCILAPGPSVIRARRPF